jgi:hypothetical protein
VTRDEYGVLKEHGERLLAIEDVLRELPDRIAERMEVKVAKGIASCRERETERHEQHDILWEQHQRAVGVRGLLSNVSRRTTIIISSIGGLVGIAGAVVALCAS